MQHKSFLHSRESLRITLMYACRVVSQQAELHAPSLKVFTCACMTGTMPYAITAYMNKLMSVRRVPSACQLCQPCLVM